MDRVLILHSLRKEILDILMRYEDLHRRSRSPVSILDFPGEPMSNQMQLAGEYGMLAYGKALAEVDEMIQREENV